jgi:hypothetical protein
VFFMLLCAEHWEECVLRTTVYLKLMASCILSTLVPFLIDCSFVWILKWRLTHERVYILPECWSFHMATYHLSNDGGT